jgi:hypothetical protein
MLGIESSPELLEYAKEVCPEIKTHIIAIWPSNLSLLAKMYKPDIISFGWLTEPLATKLMSRTIFQVVTLAVDLRSQIEDTRGMGIKVIGGIVNNPDDMVYFANLEVGGIMTDNPFMAIKLTKGWA